MSNIHTATIQYYGDFILANKIMIQTPSYKSIHQRAAETFSGGWENAQKNIFVIKTRQTSLIYSTPAGLCFNHDFIAK